MFLKNSLTFSNALHVLGRTAGVRVRGSLRRCGVGGGGDPRAGVGGDPRAGGGGQPRVGRHYGGV